MISVNTTDLNEVLQRVRDWPVHARIRLVQSILGTVDRDSTTQPTLVNKRMTADEVVAHLKMPQPSPTDEECDKVVDEARMRKYGG